MKTPGTCKPSSIATKPRGSISAAGFPRVPLPGLPWTPEFMAKYNSLVSTKPAPSPIGNDRVVPRSVRALSISYYDSAAFKALKPITQGVYRNIVDRFCREVDPIVGRLGDMSAVTIKNRNVAKLMEARRDKPDSANGLRKVLHEMMKVAIHLE